MHTGIYDPHYQNDREKRQEQFSSPNSISLFIHFLITWLQFAIWYSTEQETSTILT